MLKLAWIRSTLLSRALLAVLLAMIPFSIGRFAIEAQDGVSAKSKDKAEPTAKNLVIAPDLMQEVAKFKTVRMPFDSAHLSAREQQMISKLVEACQDLESIYWRQSDPEGLGLYHTLAGSSSPKDIALRRFLRINGSRFDLINNDAPFVGTAPRPPGRALYPTDLTHEEFDRYVAAHPGEKAALYDPWTVVRRKGSMLEAISYHVAFKEWLDPAVKALREAADLSDDPAFAKFLRLRADSLLTDQYFDSDNSGTYALSYDAELSRNPNLATVGVTRLAPFFERDDALHRNQRAPSLTSWRILVSV